MLDQQTQFIAVFTVVSQLFAIFSSPKVDFLQVLNFP